MNDSAAATTVPCWRLLWNRLQAKLHHAYPCRKCGYAYNCSDGECHS